MPTNSHGCLSIKFSFPAVPEQRQNPGVPVPTSFPKKSLQPKRQHLPIEFALPSFFSKSPDSFSNHEIYPSACPVRRMTNANLQWYINAYTPHSR